MTPRRRAGARCSAFQHRNYRLFFTGQGISLVGTWMQPVAQAWLVLQLTERPALAGRRRRRPVHPGPRLRAVRRRRRRLAAQAQDAHRDPGGQDGASRRSSRSWPSSDTATIPLLIVLALAARHRERDRHAGPPGVLGRDGRSRGHRQRGRPQLGHVQRRARHRAGRRRPRHRRWSASRRRSPSTPSASWPSSSALALMRDARAHEPGADRPTGVGRGRDVPAPRRAVATSGAPRSC